MNILFSGVLSRQGYNMQLMTCLSFVLCCLLAIILFHLRRNGQRDRSTLFCADALAKVVLGKAPTKSCNTSMNLNTTPTTINQSDISKSLYNLFIAADTCWGNGDLSGIAPENFNVLAKKFPGFKYFLIKYFTKHFIEDEERYNNIMEQFDNLMKDFFHTKYSPDYPESETNSSDVLDLYNSKYTRCTPSHFNIFLKEDVAELLKMSLLSMFYEMHATIPSDRGGSYTEILNSLFLVYFDVLNKVQIILDRPTLPRTT